MNAMRNRRALISRRRTRDPIFESKEKIKGRRIEIEKYYPVGCRVVHKQSNRSGSVVSRVNKFPRRWPERRHCHQRLLQLHSRTTGGAGK